MKNLVAFIAANDVECTPDRISVSELEYMQKELGLSFGEQLRRYILEYGYLAFGAVELYGINSRQGMRSDMVRQTLHLHRYHPVTRRCVALENAGDGDYYLVDDRDEVFEFILECGDELQAVGMNLFEHILERFTNND